MKNFKRMMSFPNRANDCGPPWAPVPAFVPYGYFSLSGSRELNIILHSMLVINRENQNLEPHHPRRGLVRREPKARPAVRPLQRSQRRVQIVTVRLEVVIEQRLG